MINPDNFDEIVAKVVNHLVSGNKVLVELRTPESLQKYLVTGIFLNARGRIDAVSTLSYSGENGVEQTIDLEPENENIYSFWLEVD